jgi:hypothetical protein
LSTKTKVDGLSVVWHQNHWDDLSVVWHQNYWNGFSRFGFKTGGNGFSQFGFKTGGGFFGLGLKTGSYDLVIWGTKSLRWFLCLGFKTKRASFCRLRHKTNGGRSARDMHRDLAACFMWKQVGLRFPSLASRLAEARRRVVHVAASWRLR